MQGIQGVVVVGKSSVRNVFTSRGTIRHARGGRIHHGIHAFINPVTAFLLESEALVLNESVTVARVAVCDLDAMNHAVAIKGMIGLLAKNIDRIRPNQKEMSCQIIRYYTDDLHVGSIALLSNGTEVTI